MAAAAAAASCWQDNPLSIYHDTEASTEIPAVYSKVYGKDIHIKTPSSLEQHHPAL